MSYQTRILASAELPVAVSLLQQGECVAFPTETVYGLGANALDPEAVAKIFRAKGRPADNPLIVHCHSQDQVWDLVQSWPREAQILMDKFWPGPLTLVLPKKPLIPSVVTGGLATVAVRIPSHPLALSLIRSADLPLAAPSANLSGKPSPTQAEHVWQDLAGKIPAILDGGPTGWGVESTVLDCTTYPFRLLRPGGVTLEELQELVAVDIATHQYGSAEIPPSPGMKYKHYSPAARVVLVVGKNIPQGINDQVEECRRLGLKVAVMAWEEYRQDYPDLTFLSLGKAGNYSAAAARVYQLLRRADQENCDVILVHGLPQQNLGMAIMNRLQKAAGPNIIHT
ncbi:MAG: L-threonylcarbamoyladenylate synthase [Bacillota bacterium]|jgi:L-threonylcarbamoyladenylate synthase